MPRIENFPNNLKVSCHSYDDKGENWLEIEKEFSTVLGHEDYKRRVALYQLVEVYEVTKSAPEVTKVDSTSVT